jgi:hypothetical protein
VKLNGDFSDLFAFAVMGEPGMLQVASNQYQFRFFNVFNMIANYPSGVFGVLNKVELKFFVIMKRKIELGLHSGEERKAVTLGEGRDFA